MQFYTDEEAERQRDQKHTVDPRLRWRRLNQFCPLSELADIEPPLI